MWKGVGKCKDDGVRTVQFGRREVEGLWSQTTSSWQDLFCRRVILRFSFFAGVDFVEVEGWWTKNSSKVDRTFYVCNSSFVLHWLKDFLQPSSPEAFFLHHFSKDMWFTQCLWTGGAGGFCWQMPIGQVVLECLLDSPSCLPTPLKLSSSKTWAFERLWCFHSQAVQRTIVRRQMRRYAKEWPCIDHQRHTLSEKTIAHSDTHEIWWDNCKLCRMILIEWYVE